MMNDNEKDKPHDSLRLVVDQLQCVNIVSQVI